MDYVQFGVLVLVGLAVIVLQVVALMHSRRVGGGDLTAALLQLQNGLERHQQQGAERTERELRTEVQGSAQSVRQELGAHLAHFQQTLAAQLTSVATVQTGQLDLFAQQLVKLNEVNALQLESMRQAILHQAQTGREEHGVALKQFGDTLNLALTRLTESNAQRMEEVRLTLETKIRDLQTDNGARLEEMRRTNVKTRGTWGEVQLSMLLEQMLTPDQYAKNVETIPGTGARVEFAIRLPGQDQHGVPMWLPIDAKFPKEQYERLAEAADRADAEGVATAGRELERAVRIEAKTIAEKYLSPPLTTDFAILFLPTEGLYAEVMRRPGLADDLQRLHRVTIAGPSTLSALLNSLQMGFRTLALEKRSSEVWQVLGAVKTEFTKFGDVLAATRLTLEKAARNIDQAETRSRQMARKLKSVEALPSEAAQRLLGADSLPDEADLADQDKDA
jgi:DNA recombination protein RmuC